MQLSMALFCIRIINMNPKSLLLATVVAAPLGAIWWENNRMVRPFLRLVLVAVLAFIWQCAFAMSNVLLLCAGVLTLFTVRQKANTLCSVLPHTCTTNFQK